MGSKVQWMGKCFPNTSSRSRYAEPVNVLTCVIKGPLWTCFVRDRAMGDYPDFTSEHSIITKAPTKGRQETQSQWRCENKSRGQGKIPQERRREKGSVESVESGDGKERFSLTGFRRQVALLTPEFQSCGHVIFWPSELYDNMCIVLSYYMVPRCSSINGINHKRSECFHPWH